MNKVKRYGKMILAVLLMAAVVILGMTLPSEIFKARDEERMGHYQSYDTEPIVVQTKSTVSFDEKMELFYGETAYVQSVPIAATKKEEKKMRKAAKREFKKLFQTGAMPEGLQFMKKEKSSAYQMSKVFVINTRKPEIAIHIWLVQVSAANDVKKSVVGTVTFAMDEESQKILMFEFRSNRMEKLSELELAEGFSGYLKPEAGNPEEYLSVEKEEWGKWYYGYYNYSMRTLRDSQYGFELLQLANSMNLDADSSSRYGM